MGYSLNEYYQMTFDTAVPHIIVYSNNADASNIVNHYKNNGVAIVSLADCLPDNATSLPMPEVILPILDMKIIGQEAHVIVVGIDAYLSLLSVSGAAAFFAALRGRLDKNNLNTIYMVSNNNFPVSQFPPQYTESRKILVIDGDYEMCKAPSIAIVSDNWIECGTINDYKELLKRLGNFFPTGNHTLVLKGISVAQAGLSSCVSFLFDVKQFAERFYADWANLERTTLETLLTRANENRQSPEIYLETEFGSANIAVRLALKRLIELPNDDIWNAYVCILLKKKPNTYLAKVLSLGVTHENLLRKYIVDTVFTLFDDPNADKFLSERSDALTDLHIEPLVIELIEESKEIDGAIQFLNCKTTAERVEIIRRASKLNLFAGLPETFSRLYPALQDYLSVEFDYGNLTLTTYFKQYRILKLSNTITNTFVNMAFETELPPSLPTREALLLGLLEDRDVALLVVDGMGAEYLPLLLAMAKRYNMNIQSFDVAYAKLPTSTEFNPIQWDTDRILEPIKGMDNVVHDGAEKHEQNSPEQNIEMSLRKFHKIFNRLAKGLNQYSRVVVTADHGSSRLAVLAHNEGLGGTLPWDGKPDDWRYSVAPESASRPVEFESQYHPKSGKTYWAIRGYNRLPKSGGKPNELHGGASLEERLVPVVVFTRTKGVAPTEQTDKKTKEQVIDKMGYDI